MFHLQGYVPDGYFPHTASMLGVCFINIVELIYLFFSFRCKYDAHFTTSPNRKLSNIPEIFRMAKEW